MEQYDESFFRKKANQRARTTYLIVMTLTTVFYLFKMTKGEVEQGWFIAMTSIGWATFLFVSLTLFIKGRDYKNYKYFTPSLEPIMTLSTISVNNPFSTTPGMVFNSFSIGIGLSISPNATSKMKLPLSVITGPSLA